MTARSYPKELVDRGALDARLGSGQRTGRPRARHGPGKLERVAAKLNAQSRKTLGWRTPAQLLDTEHHQITA
ncbi:MAG: hypothetical protein ACP5H2_08885 [Solirubrobacteraceae bacterium]